MHKFRAKLQDISRHVMLQKEKNRKSSSGCASFAGQQLGNHHAPEESYSLRAKDSSQQTHLLDEMGLSYRNTVSIKEAHQIVLYMCLCFCLYF